VYILYNYEKYHKATYQVRIVLNSFSNNLFRPTKHELGEVSV